MQISKNDSLSKTCVAFLFHSLLDPYPYSRLFLALWHLACAAWSAAVGRGEMPEGGYGVTAGLGITYYCTVITFPASTSASLTDTG